MKWSVYFNQVLRKENQLLWLMLALHAGYLNAGGFMACQRFVSHMTGFGTQVGISLGHNEYFQAFEMALMPVIFILGAATAGWMMDRKLVNNMRPRVIRGMGWIVVLDLIIWVGSVNDQFAVFGEPVLNHRDYAFLFLLAFNCGLQNGLFVTITSGQIRTTHITGLATDIGLHSVKILSMDKNAPDREELKQKNFLRVKTVAAFSFGSLISALIFQHYGYWGFSVSFFFSLMILLYLKYLVSRVFVPVNP